MKINKKTRNEAADFCAIMASLRQLEVDSNNVGSPPDRHSDAVARVVSLSAEAEALADAAFFASVVDGEIDFRVAWWAEADAMLRDGWCPGGEVSP